MEIRSHRGTCQASADLSPLKGHTHQLFPCCQPPLHRDPMVWCSHPGRAAATPYPALLAAAPASPGRAKGKRTARPRRSASPTGRPPQARSSKASRSPPCCPFIAWPLLLTNRSAPRPPPPLSLPNRRASRVALRPARRPSLVPEGGSRPSCLLRRCRPRAGAGVARRMGFICPGLTGLLSPSLYCGWGLRKEPAGTEGVPAGAPPLCDLTSPALAAFFLLRLTPAPFCYRDNLQQAEVQTRYGTGRGQGVAVKSRGKGSSRGQRLPASRHSFVQREPGRVARAQPAGAAGALCGQGSCRHRAAPPWSKRAPQRS